MRSTIYLTASALATLVNAQTFTDCNPTEKTCPNNPAMPATFETNFKAGKDAVKGWKQTAGTLNYVSSGAEFTVSKKGEAPTIQSEGYLHFGYIEVKTKAGPGAGIISSIVLQSDDLDEVDWEFVGSVGNVAQMNYFGKGNTTTYDRMIPATVSNVQELHTYALNWTAESLTWIIDGTPARTLKYGDANGGKNFPQTPSNVRIGIWAGGDSENKGTQEWAGGKVDYSKGPFTQLVESVKIINYNPGKEYQWTDKTGSYKSIKVIDAGNKGGADVNSQVIKPSASASGKGLQSAVDAPTVTGSAGFPAPSGNAGKGGSKPTGSAGAVYSNGTAANPEEPCECVETVTLTGYPPAQTPAQTPKLSTVVPPSPPKSTVTPNAPPPVTTAAVPPYPSKPVIATDSAPVPSVPVRTAALSSAPTGAIPTGSGTPPPTDLFTGAASHNTAGALFGLVAAVMALAF